MEKYNELYVVIERKWREHVLFPTSHDPLGGIREEVMHVLNALQKYGMIGYVCPCQCAVFLLSFVWV